MKKTQPALLALAVNFIFLPLMSFSQVLFQTGQSLSISSSSFEVVAIGDINNDGREDIIAGTGHYSTSQLNYNIFIYKQSAAGTFPTTQNFPYATGSRIKAIAVKDVNNDTLKDIVIGYGDSIGIFFQNTSGTLNPLVSYYSGDVDDIKVADVNNDTLADIIVCHWNAGYIRVFYQTQTGFNSTTYAKPSGGYDEIEVGDVNSDGLNDVVFMAGQGGGGIHVFIQNSGGTLNNYTSYFPGGGGFQSLNGIAIGDLNHDGANDVAASRGGNMPDAYLVIWYQDTITKLLKPAVSTAAYEIPSNIEIADFNCDDEPEIFINHGGFNAITVWSKDVSGFYTTYDNYPVSVAQHPKPEALAAGDINNDGKLDIVTVGNYMTTIRLLYNISIPTFFTNIDTSLALDTISTQDFGYTYYFTIAHTDTVPGLMIVNTDSFKVIYTDRYDYVRTDSIYTRTGSLCSSAYQDVITHSAFAYVSTQGRDTSFWSNTIDTIQISGIVNLPKADIATFLNPFSNQLTISCADQQQTTISLYTFLGQQVLQQSFTNSTTLNTAHLADGIYFYELGSNKGTLKTGKLVKQ